MLLQQLAIPQLTVDALAGKVTMNTGEPVAFFIDGVPATENDVADMNTRDVVRVEILDYLTDPKFRNSAHVVNYIMQNYEYGGYTKLNTTEMFLSCLSSYNRLSGTASKPSVAVKPSTSAVYRAGSLARHPS